MSFQTAEIIKRINFFCIMDDDGAFSGVDSDSSSVYSDDDGIVLHPQVLHIDEAEHSDYQVKLWHRFLFRLLMLRKGLFHLKKFFNVVLPCYFEPEWFL